MKLITRIARSPVFLLLFVSLIIGFFTFRDYGFTWDEPLFYKYADAVGYAYSPSQWFSGHFDLNLAYGPSATDHKTRGPAYLLLAREPVYLLEKFNLDTPSAWHLVNFLTFLLGAFFLYRLCERWMRSWAALSATAVFIAQPLLWGHAFINPKDPPFVVFLLGSVYLGFRMVDNFADQTRKTIWTVLLASFFLGIATTIRILGPLAGLFVIVYFLFRKPTRQTILWMLLYTVLSVAVMLATFPYLWENPPVRFVQVFQFMSDNPTGLQVLFDSQLYRAYDLPRRYLPFYLVFTLTEPVWPLFIIGFLVGVWNFIVKPWKLGNRIFSPQLVTLLLVLVWFIIPFAYILIRRPPMYDGMRHALFILPPIFVFAGLAFDFLFEHIRYQWLNAAILLVLLLPGVYAAIQLHPYEYTYYNSFTGGTGGAFRHYETDYWLTCYKDAVQEFDKMVTAPVKLYVHREPEVAAPYASANVTVLDERGALNQVQSGDYVLVNTRSNEDIRDFRDAPQVLNIGRAGATFCVIKRAP